MGVLGNLGNFYIVLLFGLLIAGAGVLSVNFAKKIWSGTEGLLEKKGGGSMNKWLKVAAASFAGLLIASFALGLTGTVSDTGSASGATGSMMSSSAGGSDASAHAGHHPGGQQGGGNGADANLAGYNQGMSGTGGNMGMNGYGYSSIDEQMYMMQNQIMQLQQQWSHMMQMYNQQGYYPGSMNMPGPVNQNPGMNNMSTSGSNQGGTGSNGGGMGMM